MVSSDALLSGQNDISIPAESLPRISILSSALRSRLTLQYMPRPSSDRVLYAGPARSVVFSTLARMSFSRAHAASFSASRDSLISSISPVENPAAASSIRISSPDRKELIPFDREIRSELPLLEKSPTGPFLRSRTRSSNECRRSLPPRYSCGAIEPARSAFRLFLRISLKRELIEPSVRSSLCALIARIPAKPQYKVARIAGKIMTDPAGA